MVRVVIVDDHAVVRSGLRQFFVATDDFEVAVTIGATHVRVGTALFGARG